MAFETVLLYFAAAIMLSIGSLAAAAGITMIGSKFLDGAARQPELVPMLRSQFFVIVGLVDAMPVITVAMGLYIIFVVAA
ncbi:ATP F0F1 synthase subunit C [Achromatium sp. WMS3]|nr:ATP F0F1 synthase subunit C [Achromatium sp. WMS3]